MNQEEQVSKLAQEIEVLKSQFAYINARINLIESRVQQVSIPVYDFDTLPNANSTDTK